VPDQEDEESHLKQEESVDEDYEPWPRDVQIDATKENWASECAQASRPRVSAASLFGRRPAQRVKADRLAPKVLKLVGEGQSYREISRRLGLSKNAVLDIVKRDLAASCVVTGSGP
jgi:hypothetical protein